MAAGVVDISRWFDDGVTLGATHMIVVCDTFDWEDYPVFVMPDEDVHQVEEVSSNASMQKVMEVYNLSMDKRDQLAQHRAFNY